MFFFSLENTNRQEKSVFLGIFFVVGRRGSIVLDGEEVEETSVGASASTQGAHGQLTKCK